MFDILFVYKKAMFVEYIRPLDTRWPIGHIGY